MFACAVIVVAAASTQTIPPPSQAPGQSKDKNTTVSLRGCLQGTTLVLSEDPGFEVPSRTLTLTGSRRIMRALKEHNGHQEEIVGVLKSRTDAVAVKEKRGDKSRIYVGVSEHRSEKPDAVPSVVTLDVRATKHLASACQ